MPAIETPAVDNNVTAPNFSLLATDGRTHSRDGLLQENGLLVAFLCNHCPYVKAVIGRFVEDANDAKALQIGVAAIMSNDTKRYPQDSFDNMKIFAADNAFPFPYLYDETQDIARAYDAVCTPDFFLFDKSLKLVYRGRIDDAGMDKSPASRTRELLEATRSLALDGAVAPRRQFSSIGCSIKWKSVEDK